MNKIKNTLTYANVIATVAVFLAMSGSALAVATVAKNSVTSRSIKDAAVRSQDVKDNSLTGADIDESTLTVRQSGTAAPGGATQAPKLGANSVGSNELQPDSVGSEELKNDSVGTEEVKADSLTGADVQESTFGEVPAATLGGVGRYGFTGSCNPEGFAFLPCSVVNVTLPGPARLLVIGTVRAHVEGGAAKFALGDCRIGTTSGPVEASTDRVNIGSEGSRTANLTVMAVTDVFPAGTHSFGVDCNQGLGAAGIEFEQARVTAVALSAN